MRCFTRRRYSGSYNYWRSNRTPRRLGRGSVVDQLFMLLGGGDLGGEALGLKPFIELRPVYVDAPSDFNQGGVETVCVRVENPPAQLRLGDERRFSGQLFHRPQFFVVDQFS